MADIDSKLATALKQAKTTPMFFAFIAKGSEGKVLVDKRKINPKDVADAKKQLGGGTIYRGRCKGGEGMLIFEMGKEAPNNLAALTKRTIKEAAGLALAVEYRFAADLAADETESAGEGDNATAAAATAPPAAPPTPAAAASQPQPAAAGAEVMKRLNAMAPDIKAAMLGPNKARVQALFVSVNGLIKNKDFAQAGKVLDELGPLVAKAASAAPAPPTAPPQTAAPSPPTAAAEAPAGDAPAGPNQAAEWERRMKAIEPKVLAAQKSRAGEAKWMTLFMNAQDLGSEEDFAKALVVLDKLEALLSAPPKAGSATPEIQKGIVEKRQFLLTRWKQIPKDIAPDLEALMKSIAVKEPKITNLAELRGVIDKQLQTLYDELQGEIDRAINKGDNTALKGLRERVLKHEFVNHLMANPYVAGSKFQASILNALQEVEQRMAS